VLLIVVYSLREIFGLLSFRLRFLVLNLIATKIGTGLVVVDFQIHKTRTCPWMSDGHNMRILPIFVIFTICGICVRIILNLTLCWTLLNRKSLSSQAKYSSQFVQTAFDMGMTMFLDQTRLCRCRLRWPLAFLFPTMNQTPSNVCEIDWDRRSATLENDLERHCREGVEVLRESSYPCPGLRLSKSTT
jgi:hypothetical protein